MCLGVLKVTIFIHLNVQMIYLNTLFLTKTVMYHYFVVVKKYKYTCPNKGPYVYPLPCCEKSDIPYTYKTRCCNNQRYVPVNNGIPAHMKYTYNRSKHLRIWLSKIQTKYDTL